MKLLVYVPQLSPRLKYIFSFIFNDILKTEISFTTDPGEFTQSGLPKFSYAPHPLASELFFKSTNLLFDHKIADQQLKTTNFGELKVPFPVANSTLPFDVFAASFYFLSRYEEYLPFKTAKTGLYAAEASLQHQLKLLKLPVIDGWALILKNIVLKHFPAMPFGNRHFSFTPVYASPSSKPVAGNFISRGLAYVKGVVAEKLTGKREKMAGISQLITEMQRHRPKENSRPAIPYQKDAHHFDAEMRIPKSYVKLTKNGVSNDYSMHYDSHPGFRAGTCTPFHWYDLQLDKHTRLLLHPVAATDMALLNNKTTTELLLQINELIDSVKLVNGDFYFLSLCNDIRP